MNTNRNFKDSVFTTLFNNPDLLRELYCALKGISLPQDVPVSINTLENVLFMDLYNDISFEIGGKLIILIEHQSTINPNMALRMYLYSARILERLIKSKNLFSGNRLSIPWPEFYVLYNGKEPYPDREVMRLSNLFEKPADWGFPDTAYPLLELEVTVININQGRNEGISAHCRKLAEYSMFIAKARAYEEELRSRENGIIAAIKFCSKHDILSEFLELYGSEVLNMLLTEWNTEDAIAVAREEGHEEGREEGLEQGREEGREDIRIKVFELLDQGLSADEIKRHLENEETPGDNSDR
ncbi:MAG: Rpn family recombination-promoting nuclease/putative transposase [Treponema sp.]|nr:Rpn family recombination-promoting nuclease/putative transposase [Treponema sp.]